MTPVYHYGLHFAAGSVGFLIQRGPVQSLYDVPCPFKLTRPQLTCPHAVDIDRADDRHRDQLAGDPLGAWMLNPRGLAMLLDPELEHLELVEDLTKLYNPTRPLTTTPWKVSYRSYNLDLSCTNLAPWILFCVDSRQMDLLRVAASGVYPRPVLALITQPLPLPGGGRRLTTTLNRNDLPPLGPLGAWAVRERLRRPHA